MIHLIGFVGGTVLVTTKFVRGFLAVSWLTGRRSNQLNYAPSCINEENEWL
jgi:hypothetical protein